MNGSELAEGRRSGLVERISRALGPAGVFFRGFIEHPRMVGAILPSSRAVIDAMLAPVDWQNCKLFVEYGPGIGTFCRPVLDRLPRDGELVVIDTNPLYIDYLQKTIRDSRFHAVLGSAADVEQIIRSLGHEQADFVLSGLPFSTLPEGVGPAIAAATQRIVRKGGAFLTYQYSTVARELTGRHFPRLEKGMVWRNFPPCFLGWAWQD
ncbi:methyltransferase [Altererythrobacter sp. B11]|uniref:class I SAM-dependent methyltransferase n=1 Tax=Altererythrobacter sp. B11 TaxID=2060312 RepID=UPI000DC70B8E|nr:methyltransferase [Altererythrobacter sp. B11]BBC72096.1 methyltransferase [Altererythrobacter sp. B11]